MQIRPDLMSVQSAEQRCNTRQGVVLYASPQLDFQATVVSAGRGVIRLAIC